MRRNQKKTYKGGKSGSGNLSSLLLEVKLLERKERKGGDSWTCSELLPPNPFPTTYSCMQAVHCQNKWFFNELLSGYKSYMGRAFFPSPALVNHTSEAEQMLQVASNATRCAFVHCPRVLCWEVQWRCTHFRSNRLRNQCLQIDLSNGDTAGKGKSKDVKAVNLEPFDLKEQLRQLQLVVSCGVDNSSWNKDPRKVYLRAAKTLSK